MCSFGEVVLMFYPSVHSSRRHGLKRGPSQGSHRYGVIIVWFTSGGEGIESDHRTTTARTEGLA